MRRPKIKYNKQQKNYKETKNYNKQQNYKKKEREVVNNNIKGPMLLILVDKFIKLRRKI